MHAFIGRLTDPTTITTFIISTTQQDYPTPTPTRKQTMADIGLYGLAVMGQVGECVTPCPVRCVGVGDDDDSSRSTRARPVHAERADD